jgi:hypothetical protein
VNETSETSETSQQFQGPNVSDVSGNTATSVSDVSFVSLAGEERGHSPKATNGNNGQPPLCDHCGTPGRLHPYNWAGRPDGIVLHSSCEGPWFDSEARQ